MRQRPYVVHKVSNVYYLVLHRKYLLTLGLNNGIFGMFLVKQQKYKLLPYMCR